MGSVADTNKNAGADVIARANEERRRFRRVPVSTVGRLYVPATQEEAPCTVEELSPGDAAIICDLKNEPQGRCVIYLDNFGRFEGPVVRTKPNGFLMTFTCSAQKREKLADQLTLELNRHLLGEADMRRYDRVEATHGSFTHFTRFTGDQIRCEVLDLSLTGVSVRTDARHQIGEHILIGNRAARVARHHSEGIGVEFLGTVAPASTIDKFIPVLVPGSLRAQSGKLGLVTAAR